MFRTITVRPDPMGAAAMAGVVGLVVALVSSAVVAGVLENEEPLERYGVGLALTAVGAGLIVWALRVVTTKVHLHLEGDRVRLRWTRFGRTLAEERIPRADVLDVAVTQRSIGLDDADATFYRVVLGTPRGDLALSSGKSPNRDFYAELRNEIARFLSVPVRSQETPIQVGLTSRSPMGNASPRI